jgi:aspartyl-tRNA(Asn)/glutamyl-tRNA(Gln) amidotransferase subunit A
MADELAFLSATHLLALYRTKDLSPVEVMGETLRRLERYEGALNAFVLYDPKEAMTQARGSEARWQKGEPEGLLDGVPVAIKDTVLTRGWPRLLGSRTIDPNQQWDEDSPVTARLRSEGAVFFGKTTTPEFGFDQFDLLCRRRCRSRRPMPIRVKMARRTRPIFRIGCPIPRRST